MGLFKKKSNKGDIKKKPISAKPSELPELPELPDFDDDSPKSSLGGPKTKEQLSPLPRFPNDSFGKKFSQDIIKGAVTGEKEESEEDFEADDFVPEQEQMMRQPLSEKEFKSVPSTFREAAKSVKEPIFIRIDKFEESLHAFEKAKQQITEIEKMLRDVKSLKEEEEKELGMWEREVQKTKLEIEKIDQDIFSKVE